MPDYPSTRNTTFTKHLLIFKTNFVGLCMILAGFVLTTFKANEKFGHWLMFKLEKIPQAVVRSTGNFKRFFYRRDKNGSKK